MTRFTFFFLAIVLFAIASCSDNVRKSEAVKTHRIVRTYFSDSITERVVWEYPEGNDSVISVSHFYNNKQMQMQGNIVGGVRNGEWVAWDKEGRKMSTGHYVDGFENGLWSVWYPSGQKRYEGMFKDGNRIGLWLFYDQEGNRIKEIKY